MNRQEWNTHIGTIALCCLCLSLSSSEESSEGESRGSELSLSASPVPDAAVPARWDFPPEEEEDHQETAFRGNWFKKRTIVYDARTVYEDLHTYVSTVWEPQFQAFDKEYQEVPARLRQMIDGIGFQKKDIENAQAAVQAQSVVQTSTVSTTTGQPVEVRSPEQIEQLLKQLEDLHTSYELLEELHKGVSSAITLIKQHSAQGAEQEQLAWKWYEEIDAAYDDRQAAFLFEQMKAARTYLDHLLNYLQQQSVPYCREAIERFTSEMGRIETAVKALESEQVYVRAKKQEVVQKPVEQPKQGWFARFWAWLVASVQWLVSFVTRRSP